MNSLYALDIGFFHFLRSLGAGSPFITSLATLAAEKLIYILPIHLVMMWLLGKRKTRQQALIILLSIVVGLACSYIIGALVDRPRPFVAGVAEALIFHSASPSFPSDHALIFTIYVCCLYIYRYRLMFWIALVFAILTAWARIYVGIHYPLDILGGAVIGCLVAAVVVNYGQKYILK